MRGLRAAFAILLACGGCTHTVGHQFASPDVMQAKLGETTKAEILAAYGEPRHLPEIPLPADQTQKTVTPFDPAEAEEARSQLIYTFVQNDPELDGHGVASKAATFSFWNDTLVAIDFASSFAADSTDFDETKASALKKGISTKRDVVELLGTPSGRGVYPMIQARAGERYVYVFAKHDNAKHTVLVKRLEILFESGDRVTDFRLDNREVPLPVISPVTSTYFRLPLFIPHR